VRRVFLLVSLALLGLLAVPGSTAPKPHPNPHPHACPALTDPAKDDRNADLGSLEDPTLDILGGSVSVKSGHLVVVLRMSKVGYPTWAEGVQYAGGFRYGLQDVEIWGTVAKSNPWLKSVFAVQGIRVDGSYVLNSNAQLSMALDPERGTVTLSMPMQWIALGLGVKKVTGIGQDVRLTTAGHFAVIGEPYDRATTFAPLRLAGCR